MIVVTRCLRWSRVMSALSRGDLVVDPSERIVEQQHPERAISARAGLTAWVSPPSWVGFAEQVGDVEFVGLGVEPEADLVGVGLGELQGRRMLPPALRWVTSAGICITMPTPGREGTPVSDCPSSRISPPRGRHREEAEHRGLAAARTSEHREELRRAPRPTTRGA